MVGLKIKKYLEERGITQTFVAEKAGIKQPILNAMLNGKRKVLAEEYFAICRALGVSLEIFLHKEAS